MSVTVRATYEPARGLFDQTVTTNCTLTSCGKLIVLSGPKAKQVTRKTYVRRDGQTHACQWVFCSSDCAKEWTR